jgi:DNA-binding phage protein
MVEKPRTGAERYLAQQQEDPEYRSVYDEARRRIDQVDAIVRALDDRREALGFTKAELARRAHLAPEAVRRLFSVDSPNPTAITLAALADALDLDLVPTPRAKAS